MLTLIATLTLESVTLVALIVRQIKNHGFDGNLPAAEDRSELCNRMDKHNAAVKANQERISREMGW